MSGSLFFIEVIYILVLILVCAKIVYDTRDPFKTTAYLLLAIFIPLIGIVIYFVFGINYRKRSIYSKKLVGDEKGSQLIRKKLVAFSADNVSNEHTEVRYAQSLVKLLMNDSLSPLTIGNNVSLLINGEQKFPEMLAAIDQARNYIHLEYYIYEDDDIGNRLKNMLIKKARQGVRVRFIYDDLGSRSIRKTIVPELRKGGVEAYPFNQVTFSLLANRINYRNHRKIIIIDGSVGFVGGINITDRYANTTQKTKYWRDTHLRIDGSCVLFLQHIFLCDWNFCSGQNIEHDSKFFPENISAQGTYSMQIASSGPDSPSATIMLSFLKAIQLAQEEIVITTPYFIPPASILDALKAASLGGVNVKILVPGISDTLLVNHAAWTNYGDMMEGGVEIYLYQKGILHAKTMVVDNAFSIVGTANMDIRSFDLNFEVNAIIYSSDFAQKLRTVFYNDISHATQLSYDVWEKRPLFVKMLQKLAALLSPLL
ncbi:MAG: cardiolipin synthase [Bacteroidales bacterium]